MHDSDEARIGALMTRFLRLVSFKDGDQPRYGELPALFSLHARLIRTSGPVPEISSVDEFVRTRRRAVAAGELTSFEEIELAQTTEIFGNVAHRFSSYAKRGTTNHGSIDVRGAISTQLIRTGDGAARRRQLLPLQALPAPQWRGGFGERASRTRHVSDRHG